MIRNTECALKLTKNNAKCATKLTLANAKHAFNIIKDFYNLMCRVFPYLILMAIASIPLITVFSIFEIFGITIDTGGNAALVVMMTTTIINVIWLFFCFNYAKCSDFWRDKMGVKL